MVNGRRKGSAWERQVCRYLSAAAAPASNITDRAWVTCSAKDLLFRPRPTIQLPSEGHWRGAGDVLQHHTVTHWPFCVECKNVRGWSFDQMWADKWPVWSFWKQACDQADRVGMWPCLFLKRHRRDSVVAVPHRTVQDVQEDIPWSSYSLPTCTFVTIESFDSRRDDAVSFVGAQDWVDMLRAPGSKFEAGLNAVGRV